MNALIQQIARQGQSQWYYDNVGMPGLVIAMVFALWHGKKLGVPLWKMVIVLAAVHFGMMGMMGLIWDYALIPLYKNSSHGINGIVNSIVRVFAFVPLICLICGKLLRVPWEKLCDAMSMHLLLRSAFAQLGCLFTGCCHGYEVSWGLYSPQTGKYHMPIPIFETVITLAIFGWLLYKIIKGGFQSDGTHFPRMLIYYGIMRCVCEILRDTTWIIVPFSAIALHALFLCVAGIVWLCIVKQRNKKQAADAMACKKKT